MVAPAIPHPIVMLEDEVRSRECSGDTCWVALETLGGRRFLDQLRVPQNAEQAMLALKAWHKNRLGKSQRFAQYVLCKRSFVGIGKLEVRLAFPDNHSSILIGSHSISRVVQRILQRLSTKGNSFL